MRWSALSAACLPALAVCVQSARAVDIDPYLEYQVRANGFPDSYYSDVESATGEVLSRECQIHSYSACKPEKIWYLNSIYFVDYSYKRADGTISAASKFNYHYYTCDLPTKLYLVKGDVRYGPYANREIAPGGSWGVPRCLSEDDPGPDPSPEIEHQSDLGPGDCETRPNVGNPINVGLGNKYQQVADILAGGGSPLQWHRYYNSGAVTDGSRTQADEATLPEAARLGSRWRGTYDRSLAIVEVEGAERIRLSRPTGERIDFVEANGSYQSAVDPRGRLLRDTDGWTYRPAAGANIEGYDANGRLVSLGAGTDQQVTLRYDDALVEVTDLQGRKLTFAYDSLGRIASVSDGSGVAVTYAYDETAEGGRRADLVSATYADGTSHRYIYNAQGYVAGVSRPHALTGIVDESGELFATFWYDSEGRAVRSEHAFGVDAVQLSREADGSVAVTGPTKAVHRYRYAEVRGSRRLVGVDQPGGAGCGAANSKIEYNTDGTVSRRTGFDGHVTEYRYDTHGNETERTEAPGTPVTRKIATTWHPIMDLPVRITWPGREQRFTYDAAGNLTGREEWGAIDPTQSGSALTLSRSWRMTYDTAGRLAWEEGPRSDTGKVGTLTRHTYRAADASSCANKGPCDYRKGDLWKSENALGHTEEILTHDATGRVRSRRDAQGIVYTYTYDKRGRLTDVAELRPGNVTAKTSMTYTPRGDVASITDADGITLRFEYDKAGRLIQIANPSNHRLRFELDAAGNRTGETGYDSMFLKTQIKRTFDALGRVETETSANNSVTRYTYDELGRPTGTTDADGRKTTASYDALGRLRDYVRDAGGLSASTTASYDPLDQLASIEDPKGLTTHYLTTGLGDVGAVDSPDSGETVDEYDVAGFLAHHEGAGGVGSYEVTRDALGRPTVVRYSDATLETHFTYDIPDPTCPAGERHGVGRLSAMLQSSSKTVFCYDATGNIARKIQAWAATTKAVAYRYSLAGRLQEVAVDGGARTIYRYDADGSVAGISVEPQGAAKADVITYVAYRPFDLIESWRYGNGTELTVTRDDSGRVTAWGGPDYQLYALNYTPGGEISSQMARAYAFDFGYDGLGHLKSVGQPSTGNALRTFEYNTTGDRTAVTSGGIKQDYLYDPASHRLTTTDGKTRRYDAAGNTIAIGDATLAHDAAGRLGSVSEQGRPLVSYGYDAADQRIMRTEATGGKAELVLYDEDGRWLAEYDSGGNVTRQAVWMNDYLVGLVDNGKLLYVEPDHLGSPRAVIDPTRKATVWRWRPSDDPFGTAAPDEDPDSDGTRFVFDMRFPGQRYDAATGLYYNYFRDYDAATGRYIQVDPIGLAGGVNPYVYANGSPWRYVDPLGLFGWSDMPMAPDWLVDGAAGFGDSLSFGLTRYVRAKLNIGAVNHCSRAYKNGEIADLVFETGTMGASAGLKALAAKASREATRRAARRSVRAYRNANQLEKGNVHHLNPLFGHPGNIPTTFPTGGLPASIHSGSWNLRWFPNNASHNAAHRAMRRHENGWGAAINPGTTGIRAARNIADSCSCAE